MTNLVAAVEELVEGKLCSGKLDEGSSLQVLLLQLCNDESLLDKIRDPQSRASPKPRASRFLLRLDENDPSL